MRFRGTPRFRGDRGRAWSTALLGGADPDRDGVFAWPGLGQLTVQAIDNRDFPLVQGIVMLFVTTFLVVNLLVDLIYGVIDPRVRLS